MTIRCFLVIAACLSCLGCRAATPSSLEDPGSSGSDPPATGTQAKPAAVSTVVYAYYFHQTFRCLSCQMTEEMAARAIQEHFAGQMQAGQVVWMTVNIDKPEGKVLRHQFDQLNVRASDLVLARMENGVCKESRKLDELSGLTDRPDAFAKYLVDQVNVCLSAAQGR
jgi:hypothetical protein